MINCWYDEFNFSNIFKENHYERMLENWEGSSWLMVISWMSHLWYFCFFFLGIFVWWWFKHLAAASVYSQCFLGYLWFFVMSTSFYLFDVIETFFCSSYETTSIHVLCFMVNMDKITKLRVVIRVRFNAPIRHKKVDWIKILKSSTYINLARLVRLAC